MQATIKVGDRVRLALDGSAGVVLGMTLGNRVIVQWDRGGVGSRPETDVVKEGK